MLYTVGITPQLVIVILSAIESTKNVAKALEWVFIVLLPNYNVGQGLANIYNNHNYIDLCFNQLPEAADLVAGKDSLNTICNAAQFFGRELPCCKGRCLKEMWI